MSYWRLAKYSLSVQVMGAEPLFDLLQTDVGPGVDVGSGVDERETNLLNILSS